MPTFTHFEDIEGWKKARELTAAVYEVTKEGAFGRDYGLKDQIRRSAVSVMANIAEGFGRGGNREFSSFLSTARGSCVEVKSHLYVAFDAQLIGQIDFGRVYQLASESEALISGLMKYLAATPDRGRKFVSSNREP